MPNGIPPPSHFAKASWDKPVVPSPRAEPLGRNLCQTGQSASAICHPERSRKSDAIADDADLGLAKTWNCHNKKIPHWGMFFYCWHSQWESNPCCRNENPMSWTARRWEQLQNPHRIPDVFQNVNSVQIFFHTIRDIFLPPRHTGRQTHICPNCAAYT